jgi:hypothetical protein
MYPIPKKGASAPLDCRDVACNVSTTASVSTMAVRRLSKSIDLESLDASLAALRIPAVGAGHAAFAVLERVALTAVGAFFFGKFCSVGDVFLQGADYAILPGVDRFGLELQVIHKMHDERDRHAVTQDAGDQLGIVPELDIELDG